MRLSSLQVGILYLLFVFTIAAVDITLHHTHSDHTITILQD